MSNDIETRAAKLKAAIAENLPQRSVPKMGRTVDTAIEAVMVELLEGYEQYAADKLKEDRDKLNEQWMRLRESEGELELQREALAKMGAGIHCFMTGIEYRQVLGCLHPDSSPDEERRGKAFSVFRRVGDAVPKLPKKARENLGW